MAEDVLFEVGLEELPARFIEDAEQQLKEKTEQWLQESRVSYNSITSYSTPRRLAILIKNISSVQETVEEEKRGPAIEIAKDEHGNWTKAALGFARGQGKTVDDLVEKEVSGKAYVFVSKRIEGKATTEILPEYKDIITSLTFSNNMRWGSKSLRFARPIRWLVALYGENIIPFEIADVKTGNITFGHRYLGDQITITKPSEYEKALSDNYVIADAQKRKQLILNGIEKIEKEHGFQVAVEDDLLAEVTNLVEYPTVFRGNFEQEFLDLPSDVLIISMKEHQRYFPVTNSEGELLPFFIGVRNGDATAIETVIKGNEKVLRARLADAEFFYDEDRKNSIEYYLEKLNRVVFQEKLGTLADKVDRVTSLSKLIAKRLDFSSDVIQTVSRAAEIGKFDLMTNMVDEFTELQGVIGEIYARHFNEKEEVAVAIREQYLPSHSKGDLPETKTGAVLSVAEKVDTIVGIIAIGLTPTGSQDPYALRRQAAGVLRILQDQQWDITLEEILEMAYGIYDGLEVEKSKDYKENIHEFFKLRAQYLLKELDVDRDIVDAVMAKGIGNFPYAVEKAQLLADKRHDEAFKEKEEALVRVLNLSDKAESTDIHPELFETDSEIALYEQYKLVYEAFTQYDEAHDAKSAFNELESLATPIHHFFDNNMVMADNEQIRNNRLALILSLSQMIRTFADLDRVEWKQSF